MTDSMNFGPEWLRNLSSDGSTSGGTGPSRYQLSGYRYGREEMLGLHEKGFKPPISLVDFPSLYSEQPLVPLVLTPTTDDERAWQTRAPPINTSVRGGRGTSLERGGRVSRGRGSYQSYGRNVGYESGGGGGWGNGEQSDWSPRKEYNYRSSSVDNWRRNRTEEEDGWRNSNQTRGLPEKWVRSTSWRDEKDEDRGGPQDRNNRNWHDGLKGPTRRVWEEDHLPEWATENLGEGGGTFDSTGAYHGSDDEQEQKGMASNKKEPPLQKSASQQNISTNKQTTLPSSKSSLSLSKHIDHDKKGEEEIKVKDSSTRKKEVQELDETKVPPEKESDDENSGFKAKSIKSELDQKVLIEKLVERPPPKIHNINNSNSINGVVQEPGIIINRVEEDFDRLQEDLVLKLVVEEEHPKAPQLSNIAIPTVGPTQQPPPNLGPPMHDKWFYQDPQGDLQGPFVSTEMAEWFRAGYFTLSLLVRRHCDERFYTLGDLVRLCNGNPFQTNMRIPPLKQEAPKIPEQDVLQLQFLQTQLALRQASARAYNPTEPWNSLSALQQRELLQQHLLSQQPQISPDLQYLQQTPPTNPLMHMINQMQQVNKLPNQTIPDKPPNTIPMQLDPIQALVQQMSGLQTLQNRIQPSSTGLPGIGLPPNIQAETISNNLTSLHNTIPGAGIPTSNIPSIPGGLSGGPNVLPGTITQKPLTVDSLATGDNSAINTLLRQLQSKQSQSQQIDSLWQQNQFVPPPQAQNPQWPQQAEVQLTLWDIQQPVSPNVPPLPTSPPAEDITLMPPPSPMDPSNKEKERARESKEAATKEEKKKKDLEEKQAKKEAEEKRKHEQRRQESEKKAAEEKRKKEEEKIRKELEKAKKEAEEKRLRELEEKRRLKEQRKAEEEARRKAEEQRKLEELERERRETKEREEQAKRQAEATRQAQENLSRVTRAAPWSQSNTSTGPSLADIQKAEREKRAEQAAQLVQQQQQQLQQQQQRMQQDQQNSEKPSLQLNWANKPIQPRQVKSLTEIQAEEQERLAKQTAELRLAQQQKEKDIPAVASTGIWSGQNLTWANNPATQWSSAATGFWDDAVTQKPTNKPSSVLKSNSTSAMVVTSKQQPPKPSKTKTKKEEPSSTTKTNNGPSNEEFTAWCTKALANLNSAVDIPTFVGFLRDIESAADVKEICRDYLGESAATHHFTLQFLEKRRSYKPKTNAHKDDMCSPAPAITPSVQHSTDFQEVKGKGKKSKKSKMMKVDSRILGFSVTAAQDRINVGARDYGDNS